MEAEGQLQVHTASYRGSFSSVLSQAVRSAGLGSRVLIVQFLKGGVEQGPSKRVQICGGLTWLRPDVPACVETSDHPGAADAVSDIWQFCQQSLLEGDLDHLVLDRVHEAHERLVAELLANLTRCISGHYVLGAGAKSNLLEEE